MDFEFGGDVSPMGHNGVDRYIHLVGDLFVGQAFDNAEDHLFLARGEVIASGIGVGGRFEKILDALLDGVETVVDGEDACVALDRRLGELDGGDKHGGDFGGTFRGGETVDYH